MAKQAAEVEVERAGGLAHTVGHGIQGGEVAPEAVLVMEVGRAGGGV